MAFLQLMEELQGGLVFPVSLRLGVKSCIMDQVKDMVYKGLKRETIQPVENRVNKWVGANSHWAGGGESRVER